MTKIRLTMAQALLKFVANQYISFDGQEERLVRGIFGIFGHGNVTGLGEALENDASGLPFYQGHNEQGMAHAAIAYAKQKNRLGLFACTSSIGPGATNMITAAATATTNRLPLLLLPGDIFSCRQPDPVLQQLETTHDYTVSVNDCFKPVSRYWDRINRPEQLMTACLQAFRVLTDPIETGAVVLCLPQDVQTESYDYPFDFFRRRLWTIHRDVVCIDSIHQAAFLLKKSKKPLLVIGGGVHYSRACETLNSFTSKHHFYFCETQAGKSALAGTNPYNLGGIGVTGSAAANLAAQDADLILVIGSRLQDFTTASKSAFANCRMIHLNINRYDAMKMDALELKGDAKQGLLQLGEVLGDYKTPYSYQKQMQSYQQAWESELNQICKADVTNEGLSQLAIIKLLNDLITEKDVIISAAGSLPGDLHRVWQSKSNKDYHLEYAYSCMGYEVAAGLGVRLAKGNEGEVYVLVGDGSFIMLHSELLTCIQEQQKITIIIFDNHGYQCIHNLQKAHGSKGFGNEFRYRDQKSMQLTGDYISVDFCQYAAALGAKSIYANSYEEFKQAIHEAKCSEKSTVIVLPVSPTSMSKGYHSWWRVDVAEISKSTAVLQAKESMKKKLECCREY